MAANTRIDTIWDVIHHNANLEVRCGNPRCEHTSIIDAQQMARRILIEHWSEQLAQIGPRVRCSRCGHRGGRVRPKWGEPTGPKVGPTSEAEMKARIRMRRR